MSDPLPHPVPACTRCGRDAQLDFDSVWLCLDCYHVAGSTCAGITRPVDQPFDGPEAADATC